MTNLVFALSLFIIESEACIAHQPPQPPQPPQPHGNPATTATSATSSAATTAALPCPAQGKTCVGDNVVELKPVDGPDKCSKKTIF